MKTLNEYIHHGATAYPDQLAIITPTEQITYAQLSEQILQRAKMLGSLGLQRGQARVFRASQNIDFLVTYFAIHELGAVAVPLEHSVPIATMQGIIDEVAGYPFPEGTADLLYTSGSTGRPKGVMLSDTALTACAENFIHDHHYHPDLVFIISGPLNHIASLFKIHPTLMAGGTVCVIDGLRDVNAFFTPFRQLPQRRFASFLVPASIRMLLQFSRADLEAVAPLIDFIETGAAPITQDDMRELSQVLPQAHLYNTLGGTEIGAVCTYDFNDGLYMAGCVGRPMHHSTVTISPEGTVICGGPTLMTGYIHNPEGTAAVLHDGAFHTSDRGRIDENGLLHLLGRSDDAINVGGFKADPVEIENTAMQHPAIRDCICIAAPHPIAGTCVKLLYVVQPGHECSNKTIALYLKEHLEAYKVPTLYERTEAIHLTYNGKKDRQYYKQ